jgi:UDP-N-acetylmuramoylalanine--D-glutamate ligase
MSETPASSQTSQRVVILGAGESGVGAALLAKAKGFEVFVSDSGKIADNYKSELENEKISWEEGTHTEQSILNAYEVIKSPGIPDKADIIKKLHKKEIPVISEIEFASRYTDAKLICITGTNGKTTTTMLTYHLFKKAGMNVSVAGNIGNSFARQVATGSFDYYVLEISSFMLDNMYSFKADVAVLTNITPDHLDRYDYELQNYIDSKFRITRNQTAKDVFIYCADDELSVNNLHRYEIKAEKLPFSIREKQEKGAYLDNKDLIINASNDPNNLLKMNLFDLSLKGKHNTFNSMAAGIVGQVFNIRKEIIRESLSDFQNVEHRLESVGKVQGIEFINDSKATNVNSSWYALESMDQPVIWIAGGVDKGNDYTILKPMVKEKVRVIVCLGLDNRKIHDAFSKDVEMIVNTSSASEAVHVAYKLANKGDCVLLSPACASFDLFQNYEDRGRQFKKAVKNL